MLKIKRSELRKLAKEKVGDDSIESQNNILVKISTAMSARTSYTVVGDEKEIDYGKLLNLHDLLIEQDPPHSSPLEHCARAMDNKEYVCFAKGSLNAVEIDEPNKGEYVAYLNLWNDQPEAGWCGPYKGFISYRYFIDNKLDVFA